MVKFSAITLHTTAHRTLAFSRAPLPTRNRRSCVANYGMVGGRKERYSMGLKGKEEGMSGDDGRGLKPVMKISRNFNVHALSRLFVEFAAFFGEELTMKSPRMSLSLALLFPRTLYTHLRTTHHALFTRCLHVSDMVIADSRILYRL